MKKVMGWVLVVFLAAGLSLAIYILSIRFIDSVASALTSLSILGG